MEKHERFKKAEFAAWLGILVNILLTVVKGVIGIQSQSKALIADAIHSASDIAGSLAVYIGLRAAKQPPDKEHPYGHGKAESISAIIVAIFLLLAGLQIGKSSFSNLFEPAEVPGNLAIFAVVFSIVIKEALFRYKYRLGKKLHSDALIINAYEHRSDVYSSIAALIGIGSSIIGGYLEIGWMLYGDPAAGLVVSLMVIRMAWKLGYEAIFTTMDEVLDSEQTIGYRTAAMTVPGVRRVDELFARKHGYYFIVDIKIAVDPEMTVEDAHQIGKEVKEELMRDRDVHDVLVHINPDHPFPPGNTDTDLR